MDTKYAWFIMVIIILSIGYLGYRFTTEGFTKVTKNETFYTLLSAAKKAFDELNIPFFLSTGSCLGYAREKNFIHHDNDVDIGIFAENYTPEIIDAFDKQGLKLYKIYNTANNGLKLTFYMPYSSTLYNATLDLFLYHENDDTYCWTSYTDDNQPIDRCVKKFDVKTVDFMGMKINLPDPLIDYIEEYYGKNWRIPDDPHISINYLENIDGVLLPGKY